MERERREPTRCVVGRSVENEKLLQQGKWANADVYECTRCNRRLVRKEFFRKSLLVRWFIGRFLTWREARALRRLEGLSGIPRLERRCSACLCYAFIEGTPLGRLSRDQQLPKSYFLQAEALLDSIHQRGLVHLDLRRGNNWIVQPDNTPGIIDFQTALVVDFLPCALREKLYAIDYSGLYKLWDKKCEEPLDARRAKLLERVGRTRWLWVFRGYALQRVLNRVRQYETRSLSFDSSAE